MIGKNILRKKFRTTSINKSLLMLLMLIPLNFLSFIRLAESSLILENPLHIILRVKFSPPFDRDKSISYNLREMAVIGLYHIHEVIIGIF